MDAKTRERCARIFAVEVFDGESYVVDGTTEVPKRARGECPLHGAREFDALSVTFIESVKAANTKG